jgi:predicted branched-subunit amino acid permease
MNSDSEDPFPNFLKQCLPFLIGLLDDALVVGLSRLGCHVPWLESLAPIVMGCTAVYIAIQLWQHGIPKLVDLWQAYRCQPEPTET